jgi:hypothetical protein
MSGVESDRFDIVQPPTPQGVVELMRQAFGTTWVVDLLVRPAGRGEVEPQPVSIRMDDLLPDFAHSGPAVVVTGRLAYPINPDNHSQGYIVGAEEAAVSTAVPEGNFPLLISRALALSDSQPSDG